MQRVTRVRQRQLIFVELEMWANAQRDGRPAEYRWRPLLNAAVWLTLYIECRAVTRPP